MTRRPAAVLWDMDGTLLDSEKIWDIAWRELALELGRELTEEIRHTLIGTAAPSALRILFVGLELALAPAALLDAGHWLEQRVGELFTGPIPWRPGAKDALIAVRAAGIPMVLVTNTKRMLAEHCLDTLGREYFDTSVCADEVARGKPAPDLYLRAAELVAAAPAHCVAIEDSPTGALAAEAAGCSVLVVPCEIPVPTGPGRTFRDSLVGLTAADLVHAAGRG